MLFLITVSLVVLIAFPASTVAAEYRCSLVHPKPIPLEWTIVASGEENDPSRDDYEEVCIISELELNSTDRKTFPKYRTIELFYPSTSYIAPNMFQLLSNVTVNLELRKGVLEELVYGLSRLENLKISDTGLYNFEVLPDPDGSLQTLVIHERLITFLPRNLQFLTELKLLDLSGCSLTTLGLSRLAGLKFLNVLNLADNQLTSIEVDQDIELPALVMFDVQQNELNGIDRFPEMFPGLKFTRIMRNRWDCEWVSAVRGKIWTRNITVLGADLLCGKRMNNGGLCCSYSRPGRGRLAIANTLLSTIQDVMPSSGVAAETIEPLITLKVFENDTVEAVIGVEMQNVGVYVHTPIGGE